MQKREGHFNFEKLVFDFSVLYPRTSGLSKKLKVSTLDIRIKQSGLKVSHILKMPTQLSLGGVCIQEKMHQCSSSISEEDKSI